VPGQRVGKLETAVKQLQYDIGNANEGESTTRKPRNTIANMLLTIIDSLSDLAHCINTHDCNDREDDDGETEWGMLSNDYELGWVMGMIYNSAQHSIESVWEKLITLDELISLGLTDMPSSLCERDIM
jgi:hypothetical protein